MAITSKVVQSNVSLWSNLRLSMSYSAMKNTSFARIPGIGTIESQNVYTGSPKRRSLTSSFKHFPKHSYLHHDVKGIFKKCIKSSTAALHHICPIQRHMFHTSARHMFHTSAIQCSGTPTVKVKEGRLDVAVQGQTLHIPYVWLRDHCRSERYYNHTTGQKNADPELLDRDLVPESVEVKGDNLQITWKDGHRSEFSSNWLLENFYPGRFSRKVTKQFWDAKTVSDKVPVVDYNHYMNSDSGLKDALHNLAEWGFSFVEGGPASEEGTQAVVERITFVKETLFGKMWTFMSDGSRSDTAFSSIYLGPHTDQTYSDSPAGLQVFQCLEHQGSGGETLLVDGFLAVDQLRLQCPGDFEVLCRTVVPHEYIEPPGANTPGYHLYSLGTVVSLHPASREIYHLRFNPYDRAPLNTVEPQDIVDFYKAYDKLIGIIYDKHNHFWTKLVPGKVLLIDNWRVMHGRAAFDGKRVMTGCYVGRDEWVSKARMLKAL